ncbi:uncharacterized protein A4U43_C03F31890 [Asparagus officinalis]|uniref:WIT1/2 N-terminal helical bundle domain-containing protein n=1 Tax=Asparagus officinalis TaxID=4686 RepID=A0A5P1FFC6_ASPOF|nr:uncharacterized protein A4U43_C03F31890 [Asparagus officinalis]
MAVDGDYDERREDISPNKDNMSGRATAWEVLPRVEHDVAYSSEKAQNLEMLSIQVEDVASDYLALSMENEEELSAETVEKAFEFYILSGLLNSEVKELDDFVGSLQVDIMDVGQQLSENVQSEDLSSKIEEKLQGFEKSLKKTQDIVADIRMRSVKFESDLAFAGFGTCTGADIEMDISAHSSVNTDWKEQKDEQRHFLQMLEKSLARELDLEKKLSESTHNEDELKLKLHYAEQTIYNLEESVEMILQRTFEAENAAEILLGISRELSGKVQIVQLSLKGSIFEEGKLRSKLEESAKKSHAEELQEGDLKANLQKAEDENKLTNFEALSLRDKVRKLEEQLKESNTQLQIAKGSAESSCERRNNLNAEISDMENTIKCLKEDVLRLESRAESAEEKCAQVTKINHELDEQLKLLRSSESENANVLERKLKESDTRLEHAKASVEAIEEQQSMLYSALSDMGNLIDDLKGKVSKAESRAESAESKCNLLTETNLELNEESRFLRNRLECMEASLNQAEDARLAAAKDIGRRMREGWIACESHGEERLWEVSLPLQDCGHDSGVVDIRWTRLCSGLGRLSTLTYKHAHDEGALVVTSTLACTTEFSQPTPPVGHGACGYAIVAKPHECGNDDGDMRGEQQTSIATAMLMRLATVATVPYKHDNGVWKLSHANTSLAVTVAVSVETEAHEDADGGNRT